jgi:hypothetical protein
MTGLAQQIGLDLQGAAADEAGARIEYDEAGQAIEEEFYAVVVRQNVPYHGPMGTMTQINWGFARLFAFRAARGELERYRPTFWRVAASVRVNPLWQQLFGQVMQQLQQQFNAYIQAGYDQIAAAGQLSRAISANNDAMLRGFEQQRQAAARSDAAARAAAQESAERASPAERFSDAIRGVERVEDPYWGESEQDANYDYHWTDGQGSYQSSNDPFFNPNIGSTQNWSLMKKKS